MANIDELIDENEATLAHMDRKQFPNEFCARQLLHNALYALKSAFRLDKWLSEQR